MQPRTRLASPVVSSSSAKPTLDLYSSLREKSARERHRLFLIEGVRFVSAALEAGARFHSLMVCPEMHPGALGYELERRLCSSQVPTRRVSRAEFQSFSLLGEPQGIAAAVELRWVPLGSYSVRRNPLLLGIEEVRNAGNLGTILRSCDAVGADGLVVFDRSSEGSISGTDPHDPHCVRASMGGIFSVDLVRTTHSEFRKWKARNGLTVLGATPDTSTDYRQVSYRRSVMLMLGSERKGLSEGQVNSCDGFVRIPMAGRSTSINLAIAASVLLYEAFGQRHPVKRSQGPVSARTGR